MKIIMVMEIIAIIIINAIIKSNNYIDIVIIKDWNSERKHVGAGVSEWDSFLCYHCCYHKHLQLFSNTIILIRNYSRFV